MTPATASTDARRFVPLAVRRTPRSATATSRTIDAVVLVCDLVGFTPTVAALAAQGRHGHARLMTLLDEIFCATDACIERRGGEVVQRIGDATIAVFEGADGDAVRSRAIAAADAIAGLHALDSERPASRVGLAAGACELLVVPFGRRSTWTLLGDATALAAKAQAKGTPNSVTADPSLARWTGSVDPAAGSDDIQADDIQAADIQAADTKAADTKAADTKAADLSDLLPRALRTVGGDDDWIGEVRPLTTMFCRLEDARGAPLSSADAIGAVLARLHEVYEITDCSLDQLCWDEKGLQALSILGTGAERSPEHAALRAVDTALRAIEMATAHEMTLTVGIATDTAVIGAWGGDGRRSFTAMGPAVNLSARLAGLGPGGVWVDEETARLAAHDIEFDRHVRPLKGVGEVTVCAPRRVAAPSIAAVDRRRVVGRAEELRVLRHAVDHAKSGGRSAVVVTGAPGVGKSTLLDVAVAAALHLGLRVVELRGDPVVGDTPLHTVGALVRAHRSGAWPPEHWSSALGGPDRFSTIALVQADVGAVLPAAPFVAVLRQAHWMDATSLEVLLPALRDASPHALLVEHREPELPDVLARLLAVDDATTIHLEGLGRDEVGDLIAHRLGLRTVPDLVVDRVHHHAAGNPFMVDQLVDSALASGEIELVGDLVRLRSAGDASAHLDVPTDVHRLVAGAIDALDPIASLALKAAATIGYSFDAVEVRRIHPMASTEAQVTSALEELQRAGLVIRDGHRLRFAHSITRDVAVSLLTPTQRKSLHRSIAELIEAERSHEDHAVELLAHHWTEADDPRRALPYLSEAALRSSTVFAGPHTARYVEAARALVARHGLDVDSLTEAQWHIALGEAARTAGDLPVQRRESQRALELVGLQLPQSSGGRVLAIAAAVVEQARLRMRGIGSAPSQYERDLAAAALAVLRTMNLAAAEDDDLTLTLLVNLLSMNVAEAGGLDDNLTAGYGMAEVAARSLGLRRVANMYQRLADRAAVDGSPMIAAEVRAYHGLRLLGEGHVDRASRLLQEAYDIYDSLGTRYIADVVQAISGYADYFRGDLEGALMRYRRMGEGAARRGDPRMSGWGSNGEAMALCALGRDSEAQDRLDAGSGLPSEPVSMMARLVLQGLIDVRSGKPFAEAERSVTAAAEALVATPPSFAVLLCQYVFVAESVRLLRIRAVDEAPQRARSLRHLHRKVVVRFSAFRAIFPVARPSYREAALGFDRLRPDNSLTRLRVGHSAHALQRSLRGSAVGVFPNGTHSFSTSHLQHHRETS